jgi:hypothetical protein
VATACRSSTLANSACVSIVFDIVVTSFADSCERLRISSTLGTGVVSRTLAAFFRDRGTARFLVTRVGAFLAGTCFGFAFGGVDCIWSSWELERQDEDPEIPPYCFGADAGKAISDLGFIFFDAFRPVLGVVLEKGRSRFGGSISLSLWLSITGVVEGLGSYRLIGG